MDFSKLLLRFFGFALLSALAALVFVSPKYIRVEDLRKIDLGWCIQNRLKHRIKVEQVPSISAVEVAHNKTKRTPAASGGGNWANSSCPTVKYHFYDGTEEAFSKPLRKGSEEYIRWADTKRKAEFILQTNPRFQTWPQEKGGFAERAWGSICRTIDVEKYTLKDGITNLYQSTSKGNGVGLILQFAINDNVWHALQDSPALWCAIQIAESLTKFLEDPAGPPWDIELIMDPVGENDWHARWIQGFLSSSFKRMTFKPPNNTTYKILRHWHLSLDKFATCAYITSSKVYTQELQAILLGVPPERFKMSRLETVKKGFDARNKLKGITTSPDVSDTAGRHVAVIRRGCARRDRRTFVDSQTGRFDTILQEMCNVGLQPHGICLSASIPLSQQYHVISQANALVSSHGAQLANLIWLSPGSSLIEITMRYGHCCRPLPKAFHGRNKPPCTSPCRAYEYTVYQHMSTQFGIKYYYYDPVYLEQLWCDNVQNSQDGCGPTSTTLMLVESKKLARVVSGILE